MNPRHTLLAEYFCTDDKTFVFGMRAEWTQPKVVEIKIPLADIRRETAKFFGDNLDVDGNVIRRAADKIFELDEDAWQSAFSEFIAPLLGWTDEGDIVWLVPHDALHYLPLHALKLKGRYLFERNPVVYSPSASVMKYCHLKRKGCCEHALVLGDSQGDLRHAREEARAIAGMFHTTPFLQAAANKELVKQKLNTERENIDVLHFACHGYFDRSQPLRSGIVLAENADEDPNLTTEEIFGLQMHAELVVLSACETGVNERKPGDELIGLTRALIYAGTPTVMVSLWSVEDLSTRLLMQTFYEEWLPRHETPLTKAEASQRAQLALLQMTAEDVLKRLEHFRAQVQGEDVEIRRAILDWDKAKIQASAGDFMKAVQQAEDVLTQMRKLNQDTRQLEKDLGRWELASAFPSSMPDYSRCIYAKPYYWAPFVLVGDWN
jgi:CHAT domain-containing protein